MKKAPVLTTAVLIGVSALSLAACSSDRGPKHDRDGREHAGKEFRKGGMERGFKDLNLTEEQKTKIRAIMEEGRDNRTQQPDDNRREAFRQQMENYRAAEQNLMKNPAFDEAAARNLIAQREQGMEEQRRQRAEFELQQLKKRHAVFQVLTPEQQQKWLEKQNDRGNGKQRPQRQAPAQ
ncbi:Spy/CpxP family protein refolding chaperone [Neisseria dentiae]|uniref:Spy/CpxP family protein refolding chaperone n=1 Tax=Neisseria dentiae TaxID=194197 RepID=UPI00359F94A3